MFSIIFPVRNSCTVSTCALVLARANSIDINLADAQLTPAEQVRRESFLTRSRRNQFSLGRFVAKRSAQILYPDLCLDQLEVLPDEEQRPHFNRSTLGLSIAHSQGAVAAVCFSLPFAIGVDIEDLSSESCEAIASALPALSLPGSKRNAWSALIGWTAAEAVFKATGIPEPRLLNSRQISSWSYQSDWQCGAQRACVYSWEISDQICSLALVPGTILSAIAESAEAVADKL